MTHLIPRLTQLDTSCFCKLSLTDIIIAGYYIRVYYHIYVTTPLCSHAYRTLSCDCLSAHIAPFPPVFLLFLFFFLFFFFSLPPPPFSLTPHTHGQTHTNSPLPFHIHRVSPTLTTALAHNYKSWPLSPNIRWGDNFSPTLIIIQ